MLTDYDTDKLLEISYCQAKVALWYVCTCSEGVRLTRLRWSDKPTTHIDTHNMGVYINVEKKEMNS